MAGPKKFKVTTKTKLPALRESYDERSLYPWMSIRTEYIEGYENDEQQWVWPGIKELAERHRIPQNQLQNRINKERWLEYKKAHQNQIAVERQKEHAKALAGKAVKFDEQAVETAVFANDLIQQRLEELSGLQVLVQKNREILIEAVEAGEYVKVSELKASAISGAELESLAKAFAMFNETGRRALGIKDGESPVTQTNITVQQTNIREELNRTDADRVKEMMRVLGNQNFSMPALESSEDEYVVDAEVMEDEEVDDDRTE